jgi:putative transposase
MTRPRREQVCLEATPFYHCISRCVRRAFLCGQDAYSNQNYEHRRQWVLDRVRQLSFVFAIDVCAYAIMSNHYHLVLRIDQQRCERWSDEEVVDRWCELFSGHLLIERMRAGESLSTAERQAIQGLVDIWRSRLSDLGWYMRCLNEYIARLANAEDDCTGRFWEGRYKSQALLDQTALLTCMSYVDLNPIRANLADTPEDSDFTSIQARLKAVQPRTSTPQSELADRQSPSVLLVPFAGNEKSDAHAPGIAFGLTEYLALVDWSGRAIRENTHGAIANDLPPILERLGLDGATWLATVRKAGHRHGLAKGALERIREYAQRIGKKWIRGQSYSRAYCCQPSPI